MRIRWNVGRQQLRRVSWFLADTIFLSSTRVTVSFNSVTEIKRWDLKVYNSLPTNVELKNEWNHTSVTPIRRQCVLLNSAQAPFFNPQTCIIAIVFIVIN